jgi:hypothetical protein
MCKAHARPASAGKPKPALGATASVAASGAPAVKYVASCTEPAAAAAARPPHADLPQPGQVPGAGPSPPPPTAAPAAAAIPLSNDLQPGLAMQPQSKYDDALLPASDMLLPQQGYTSALAASMDYYAAAQHGPDLYTPFAEPAYSPYEAHHLPPQAPGAIPAAVEAADSRPAVVDRYPSWSSYASSAGGGSYSPAAVEAEAADSVDPSGESLLRWVRPSRSNTQSFSRQSAHMRVGGASSPSPARLAMQAADSQAQAHGEGLAHSFSGSPGRSQQAPAGIIRSNLSPSPSASAYNPDLYSSMAVPHCSPGAGSGASSSRSSLTDRSYSSLLPGDGALLPVPIQHRRPTRASSISSASARSAQGPTDLGEPPSPLGLGPQVEPEPEVEARSESLLLWRLPTRPSANVRKSIEPAVQSSTFPDVASSGAVPGNSSSSAPATGGGILQKLDGLKKKLFGSDVPPAQQEVPRLWSIPAIRTDVSPVLSRPLSRLGK